MSIKIRPADPGDADALGRMGAGLARLHHDWDPERFLLEDDVEEGYRWWLTRESKNKKAVVLVAELDGKIVGYAYGRAEPRDWNLLLDAYGGFHDLWLEPEARGSGLGEQLVREMVQRLKAMGVPRIVLSTSAKNDAAQRFFAKLGWRPTMVEMTREV
jgi:ribosomal protein S18 acetylase RimI-like enzyme